MRDLTENRCPTDCMEHPHCHQWVNEYEGGAMSLPTSPELDAIARQWGWPDADHTELAEGALMRDTREAQHAASRKAVLEEAMVAWRNRWKHPEGDEAGFYAWLTQQIEEGK